MVSSEYLLSQTGYLEDIDIIIVIIIERITTKHGHVVIIAWTRSFI